MEVEIKDFVGVFKGAFSPQFCENAIKTFENAKTFGMVNNRQQNENIPRFIKDSEVLGITADTETSFMHSLQLGEFNRVLWEQAFPVYTAKYDIIKEFGDVSYYEVKIQKTEVGGGYHVWHQEISKQTPKRLFLFILYLNDVAEGGETELLYYPRRLKPEQGTLVIFPAGFTHTHRGNPPLTGARYILNGWVEL